MADDPSAPVGPESRGEAAGRDRLAGRRILVVGGGQQVVDPETDPVGNGRAISRLLAREGAAVAVADRNLEAAEATVRDIAAEGARAIAIRADASEEPEVVRMVAEAAGWLGGIDGAVLNVGIGPPAPDLAGVSAETWDRVLGVNLRGAALACRELAPRLGPGSAIVFISSVAGVSAGSRLPAYDASKAALGGLMRHVALEGARRGVRANIVAPGLIDTPLGRRATQGRPSRGRTPVPLGRQGTGWEVAYATLFLLGGESAYVTGQTLAVDGGLTGVR